MRFICLSYADEKAWENLSEREKSEMIEECLAFDEVLYKGINILG